MDAQKNDTTCCTTRAQKTVRELVEEIEARQVGRQEAPSNEEPPTQQKTSDDDCDGAAGKTADALPSEETPHEKTTVVCDSKMTKLEPFVAVDNGRQDATEPPAEPDETPLVESKIPDTMR